VPPRRAVSVLVAAALIAGCGGRGLVPSNKVGTKADLAIAELHGSSEYVVAGQTSDSGPDDTSAHRYYFGALASRDPVAFVSGASISWRRDSVQGPVGEPTLGFGYLASGCPVLLGLFLPDNDVALGLGATLTDTQTSGFHAGRAQLLDLSVDCAFGASGTAAP
jgi:hypothetical protein